MASLASRGAGIAAVLDGLSEPSAVIGSDYRLLAANRAYRERFLDGGTVRGRSCFEASHQFTRPCGELGESCPLERARATGRASRSLHVHQTSDGAEHEEVVVQPLSDGGVQPAQFIERLRPTRIASARPARDMLVGRSPTFNAMLELVARAGPSGATVLLQGESGTGKELVARAVHALSPRASRPFVPLDCSGLNESLFESELFGHERGAFTGAGERKRGLVEVAHGGTLFLDEVGDIPLSQQVKLLRLLETGTFRRVGAVEPLRSDFRLVCATHRDLAALVGQGSFREDLFFRMSTFPIRLPPLRERLDDIPLLVESFLQNPEARHVKRVHAETLALLGAYRFPGNVRELQNLLERACLLVDGDVLLPEHLPPQLRGGSEDVDAKPGWDQIVPLSDAESSYLRWAVARFDGDRSQLARLLGLSERTLYRKLRRLRGRGQGARLATPGAGTTLEAGSACPSIRAL
jgi:two-component system response regulator HydG